jgi:hypothetical protein
MMKKGHTPIQQSFPFKVILENNGSELRRKILSGVNVNTEIIALKSLKLDVK